MIAMPFSIPALNKSFVYTCRPTWPFLECNTLCTCILVDIFITIPSCFSPNHPVFGNQKNVGSSEMKKV